MRARFRFRSEFARQKKTTRAEERHSDDPLAEVHVVHFRVTSMTQQLNLTGYFQLAEHQRRISGTDIGVGEYLASPPTPKKCLILRNGHYECMTPRRLARDRRIKRRHHADPFTKRIELLAKSAKKLFR